LVWHVAWEDLAEIANREGFDLARPGLGLGSGEKITGTYLGFTDGAKYQSGIKRLLWWRR
jgi:hypothetical protein